MKKLIIAALLASSATVLSLPASAEVYVNVAPPVARHEAVPVPRTGYVWVPGYWDWRGNKHVWSRGHWERERHGFHWHPSRWVEREGRWVLVKGRWDRQRFVDNRRGDRDGDGVPNRYDRAPNNPNRR